MRLVLQRAAGDCGIAGLATLLEQSYEDVYLHAAGIEPVHRGKLGIHIPALQRIAKACGSALAVKATAGDDDEGLLIVKWRRGSRHYRGAAFRQHLIAIGYGVAVDPADGLVLPLDEYLDRERATAGTFLELQ